MPGEDPVSLLEYLSTLRRVNRQWENEILRKKNGVSSNSEITGRLSQEINILFNGSTKLLSKRVHSDDLVFPPFSVRTSEVIGRHFVSSEELTAGEVLLVEPPVVSAPLVISPLKKSKSFCIQCMKEVRTNTCEHCGMFICGKECNNENHKAECSVLLPLRLADQQSHILRLRGSQFKNKIDEISVEEDRLAAIKMLEAATSSFMEAHKLKILKYYPMLATLKTLTMIKDCQLLKDVILALQGNVNPLSQQFLVNAQRVVNPLLHELKLSHSDDFLHNIASIWDTNGFEVMIEDGSKCQGLYPASSLLTHSCLSNCEHTFTTSRIMVLRAVDDIAKEIVLTICYTDPLWPTHVRVDHLLKTKYFECKCIRCSDPTELGTFAGSILCSECQGFVTDQAGNKELLKCRTCCKLYEKRKVFEIEAKLSRELGQFQVITFREVEEKIKCLSNILHEKHHLILRLKFAMLVKLKNQNIRELQDDEIESVFSLASSLLEAVTVLYPKYSSQKARVMKEVFRIWKERNRRKGGTLPEALTPKEVKVAELVLSWYGQTMGAETIS